MWTSGRKREETTKPHNLKSKASLDKSLTRVWEFVEASTTILYEHIMAKQGLFRFFEFYNTTPTPNSKIHFFKVTCTCFLRMNNFGFICDCTNHTIVKMNWVRLKGWDVHVILAGVFFCFLYFMSHVSCSCLVHFSV